MYTTYRQSFKNVTCPFKNNVLNSPKSLKRETQNIFFTTKQTKLPRHSNQSTLIERKIIFMVCQINIRFGTMLHAGMTGRT